MDSYSMSSFSVWFLHSAKLFWDSPMLSHRAIVHSFLLLSRIPLYSWNTVYLSIHLRWNIWVVSTLGILQVQLLWTFVYKFLCGNVLSFLLGKCLGVKHLGHIVNFFKKLYHRIIGHSNSTKITTKQWRGKYPNSPGDYPLKRKRIRPFYKGWVILYCE